MYSPGSLNVTLVEAFPSVSEDAEGANVTSPLWGPRYFRHRTESPSGCFVRGFWGRPSSVADTLMVAAAVSATACDAGSAVTVGARFSPFVPSIVVFLRSMIEYGFNVATTLSVLP